MNQTVKTPVRFDAFAYIEQALRMLIRLFDTHYALCTVTADAEGTSGADVRRFTVQVTNRHAEAAINARWLVRFNVGTAAGGLPAGTQTLAIVTGTAAATSPPISNQSLDIYTDIDGKAVVDVTVVGAASRYVSVVILGEVMEPKADDISEEFAWAA